LYYIIMMWCIKTNQIIGTHKNKFLTKMKNTYEKHWGK
jgi:hypothetical protein